MVWNHLPVVEVAVVAAAEAVEEVDTVVSPADIAAGVEKTAGVAVAVEAEIEGEAGRGTAAVTADITEETGVTTGTDEV